MPQAGPEPGLTTGEWMLRWLAGRVPLRPATARSYAALTRDYLVPYLGAVPLAALTAADVQGMFTAIIRDGGVLGKPVSAATLQRIHATLRAGLNGAVRAGLIPANPGRFPELPKAIRPRPQVWTPAMTERWQREGWRPRQRLPVPGFVHLAAGAGEQPVASRVSACVVAVRIADGQQRRERGGSGAGCARHRLAHPLAWLGLGV